MLEAEAEAYGLGLMAPYGHARIASLHNIYFELVVVGNTAEVQFSNLSYLA